MVGHLVDELDLMEGNGYPVFLSLSRLYLHLLGLAGEDDLSFLKLVECQEFTLLSFFEELSICKIMHVLYNRNKVSQETRRAQYSRLRYQTYTYAVYLS